MPIRFSKSELLDITGGQSSGSEKISFQGLERDPAQIRGGELFVMLKEGGHGTPEALRIAFDRGASLFIVDDSSCLASFPELERVIIVPSSLLALEQIAYAWRQTLQLPVVAISGGLGKTTIKEFLTGILLRSSRGIYTLNSDNDHAGVLYSICRMDTEHAWAIVELGLGPTGLTSKLAKILQPKIALITKITPRRLDLFSSNKEICLAAFEVVEGLVADGEILIDGDDPIIKSHLQAKRYKYPVKFYGRTAGCEVQLTKEVSLGLDGLSFEMQISGSLYPISISTLGIHNCMNASAAVLAARSLAPGINDQVIIDALAAMKMPITSLQAKPLRANRVLLDDCAEADPESMLAAMALVKQISDSKKRVVLVLGDMLGLGTRAQEFHKAIADAALKAKPVTIISVGQFSQVYRQAAAEKGIDAFAAESAIAAAHTARKLEYDLILIKGSPQVGLAKTVELLLERDGAIFSQMKEGERP